MNTNMIRCGWLLHPCALGESSVSIGRNKSEGTIFFVHLALMESGSLVYLSSSPVFCHGYGMYFNKLALWIQFNIFQSIKTEEEILAVVIIVTGFLSRL